MWVGIVHGSQNSIRWRFNALGDITYYTHCFSLLQVFIIYTYIVRPNETVTFRAFATIITISLVFVKHAFTELAV